ncbi:MAG TPA: GNAT family N-acetyltransferase [Blastocatellia bacterium]|nr:GNAT family N-acetyltransferase [Blastocatellia bacterium]
MSQNETHGERAGLRLREADARDDDFLFALYASTRRDEMAAWGMEGAQQEMFLRLQYRAQQQRHAADGEQGRHQIILRGESAVGRIIVVRAPDEIRLADIALLPEHRGGGFGSALIRDLQDEAARSRLPVRLHVARDNRGSARLYERLGFAVTGDTGSHFKMEWLPPEFIPR